MTILFFKANPDPPSKPIVTDIEETQMRVSWNPPDFTGGTPITGYLLEYKYKGSSEWVKIYLKKPTDTQVVKRLATKTKYHFRVTAKNQVGMSNPSTFSDVYETLGKICFLNKEKTLLLLCLDV